MEKLEGRANSSFHSPPCIWFCFVEDVHGIMDSNYIKQFHQYLNTIRGSIKFTKEEEHEGSLALLDVLVTRIPEGMLQITVFRKLTHTGRYLPFSSHHPLQQKLSIPRTLFFRVENIIKDSIQCLISTIKPLSNSQRHTVSESTCCIRSCSYLYSPSYTDEE